MQSKVAVPTLGPVSSQREEKDASLCRVTHRSRGVGCPISPAVAANPPGTGQPNQSCEEQPSGPPGFDSGGFANAEEHYAGNGRPHRTPTATTPCLSTTSRASKLRSAKQSHCGGQGLWSWRPPCVAGGTCHFRDAVGASCFPSRALDAVVAGVTFRASALKLRSVPRWQ